MIDVPRVIAAVKDALGNTVAEESLLETIEEKLKLLREAYLSNKHLFTPEDVRFLKDLGGRIRKQLLSFIELKEELSNVDSIEEYLSLERRLVGVKTELQGLAVCQRVSKEIRGLHERLPQIKEQNEINRQSKISARIREIEGNAPRCRKGHLMVVREKEGSYFWGCSKYPSHTETKPLSAKEEEYLG